MSTSIQLPVRQPLTTFLRLTPKPSTTRRPAFAPSNLAPKSSPITCAQICICITIAHSSWCKRNPYLALALEPARSAAEETTSTRECRCTWATPLTTTDGAADELVLVHGDDKQSAVSLLAVLPPVLEIAPAQAGKESAKRWRRRRVRIVGIRVPRPRNSCEMLCERDVGSGVNLDQTSKKHSVSEDVLGPGRSLGSYFER
jgi:hypothetical protein